MKQPIVFEPVYVNRVWGGRSLATVYGRSLPGDNSMAVGESWEVVDRPEVQSVVVGGQYYGQTLGRLWQERREEVFGRDAPGGGRFPLLCKILDVRQNVSIQVHPPAGIAEELGGEPKSEFWYVCRADEGAKWYAGLETGVTRKVFEDGIRAGTLAECLQRILVEEGDAISVPSGQVHALGAGQLVFEIQENSNTSYRIFDWDRVGLSGAKRDLQIDEALRCIDFDVSPDQRMTKIAKWPVALMASSIEEVRLSPGAWHCSPPGEFSVVMVVSGQLSCGGILFQAGSCFLMPASSGEGVLEASAGRECRLLSTTWIGRKH